MKVLFHVINGVGLGHLVRATQLAKSMRALVPGVEILVLTNAHDVQLLTEQQFDFVQLPPRLTEPHVDPDRALVSLPLPLEYAAQQAVIAAFSPDLVIFDTHAPRPALEAAQRVGARSVMVLRELRPENMNAWFRNANSLFLERMVMPHPPDEIDTKLAPSWAALFAIGHVVRDVTQQSFSETTVGDSDVSTCTSSDRPTRNHYVVALAGGGGQPVDAARYLRAVADAHWLTRARIPDLQTLLVLGPYGKAPANLEGFTGLTVVQSTNQLFDEMSEADVILAQAGYNTIAEIRALRKASVLVPGYRKTEDQSARANRLVGIGAAMLSEPDARQIADQLEALLLDQKRRETFEKAHDNWPLVRCNDQVAQALLRPVSLPNVAKRCVFVAHDFAPRVGGMETVALNLARQCVERGWQVRVYTVRRLGADMPLEGLPADCVRPIFSPRYGGRGIDLQHGLSELLVALEQDEPDVVHLCNAGLSAWVPLVQDAWPCAITVHVHGNDLVAPWVQSDNAEQLAALMAEGLSRADQIVAVSEFSASLAIARGASKERVVVVPNGVEIDRFRPTEQPDNFRLLTVSRLVGRKGHRDIILALPKVIKKVPQVDYAFTGASEAKLEELLRLAESVGVRDHVTPLGVVPDCDLPDVIASCAVFVLTPQVDEHDVEGFGVAYLEAAACQRAAVGTRAGGVPEAVSDGETGWLVDSGDVDALADVLISALLDRADTASRAKNARARVERDFSWHSCVLKLENAWQNAFVHAAQRQQIALPTERRALINELTYQARAWAFGQLRERNERVRVLQKTMARGRRARLRVRGDGFLKLFDALEDCKQAGVEVEVEIKLRRFLDDIVQRFLVPHVQAIQIVHNVPAIQPKLLLERLENLPQETIKKIDAIRVFLTDEAKQNTELMLATVQEVHALRTVSQRLGVVFAPPPEMMRYLSVTPAGSPPTGMIEPTNLCNLACPTCPTGTGKIKPLPEMPVDRFESVVKQLTPRLRTLALWNYGEPMLHKQLGEIIRVAKQSGVTVVKVSSNAHFMDEKRGLGLLESGLDVLIISLDGVTQETYSVFRKDGEFERVANAVKWFCEEKKRRKLKRPRVELQFIVMRHNEHELPAVRELAKQWGVDRLRIKTVGIDSDENRSLVPVNRLLSRYSDDGVSHNHQYPFCIMAWDHTVVNVDGSVTPCCYLRPDMGEQFVMGNVFDTPFQEIWRGEKYQAFRLAMLTDRTSMPVCGKCRGGTHDLVNSTEEVPRER